MHYTVALVSSDCLALEPSFLEKAENKVWSQPLGLNPGLWADPRATETLPELMIQLPAY